MSASSSNSPQSLRPFSCSANFSSPRTLRPLETRDAACDVGMGEGPLLCTGAGRWVSRLPREASAAGHSWAPPLQGTLSPKGPGRAGLGPPAPARGLLGQRLAAHTAPASGAAAWCLWGPGFYKRLCHQEPGTAAARAASSLLCPRGSLLTSFQNHRKRPRLPSSFRFCAHTCVLCLVVLL